MMFPIGTEVKTDRDERIQGRVIGYGVLSWPGRYSDELPDPPTPVYLVCVHNEGSSSRGSAVVVLNAEHTREVV